MTLSLTLCAKSTTKPWTSMRVGIARSCATHTWSLWLPVPCGNQAPKNLLALCCHSSCYGGLWPSMPKAFTSLYRSLHETPLMSRGVESLPDT